MNNLKVIPCCVNEKASVWARTVLILDVKETDNSIYKGKQRDLRGRG